MVGLVISVSAILVSIRSCSISRDALNISKTEFENQRTAIWQAAIDNIYLYLQPIDKSISLQKAHIDFPPQFEPKQWDILPPKYGIPLAIIETDITSDIQKNLPIKEGQSVFSWDASMPIVIDSKYIAKGCSFADKSIYEINFNIFYDLLKPSSKPRIPKVQINGLMFLRHLKADEHSTSILETLWSQERNKLETTTWRNKANAGTAMFKLIQTS